VSFGHWLDRVAAGEDLVVARRGKPIIRLTAVTPDSAQPSVKPARRRELLPTARDGIRVRVALTPTARTHPSRD